MKETERVTGANQSPTVIDKKMSGPSPLGPSSSGPSYQQTLGEKRNISDSPKEPVISIGHCSPSTSRPNLTSSIPNAIRSTVGNNGKPVGVSSQHQASDLNLDHESYFDNEVLDYNQDAMQGLCHWAEVERNYNSDEPAQAGTTRSSASRETSVEPADVTEEPVITDNSLAWLESNAEVLKYILDPKQMTLLQDLNKKKRSSSSMDPEISSKTSTSKARAVGPHPKRKKADSVAEAAVKRGRNLPKLSRKAQVKEIPTEFDANYTLTKRTARNKKDSSQSDLTKSGVALDHGKKSGVATDHEQSKGLNVMKIIFDDILRKKPETS